MRYIPFNLFKEVVQAPYDLYSQDSELLAGSKSDPFRKRVLGVILTFLDPFLAKLHHAGKLGKTLFESIILLVPASTV